MNIKLGKGILTVFFANIINLIFNVLTNFLLPKYLSIDSYSAIKTFQLYTSYVGVFSLGCADGMYLRYGGEEIANIDKATLKIGTFSFRVLMIIESLILIPIAFIYGDMIILAFCFTILSMNMISYFKNLFQAVGEFKLYGRISNLTVVLTFLANIFFLFIIHTDNYLFYLISYVVVDIIIWIILEMYANSIMNKYSINNKISVSIILNDIRLGFLLLVGNFSNIMLSTMDRWFVKVLMESSEFAYYSFAVSMEGFLNVAITPITITLYNYFCNNRKKENVINIRKYIIIFGSFLISAAFPAKYILEHYLQNYMEASNVLFIIFGSQLIYMIIKGIYINLYKAEKKTNQYFIKLVLVIIIGFILNAIMIKIYPRKEMLTIATLISSCIWLLICIKDFEEYSFSSKEYFYIIIVLIAFIAFGYFFSSIIGLILYLSLIFIMLFILMRSETKGAILFIRNMIKK